MAVRYVQQASPQVALEVMESFLLPFLLHRRFAILFLVIFLPADFVLPSPRPSPLLKLAWCPESRALHLTPLASLRGTVFHHMRQNGVAGQQARGVRASHRGWTPGRPQDRKCVLRSKQQAKAAVHHL